MMQYTEITSAYDKERLIECIDHALGSWLTYSPSLEFFKTKVQRTRALSPVQFPDDMITMDSRFALTDDRSRNTFCYTLVFPEEQSERHGKLSVLSPMGMTLFGARVGDEVMWMSAAGPEIATIGKLFYQPESASRKDMLPNQAGSMPELFLG